MKNTVKIRVVDVVFFSNIYITNLPDKPCGYIKRYY